MYIRHQYIHTFIYIYVHSEMYKMTTLRFPLFRTLAHISYFFVHNTRLLSFVRSKYTTATAAENIYLNFRGAVRRYSLFGGEGDSGVGTPTAGVTWCTGGGILI